MFKPVRWRSEKKIKVVFKLQFQATQVPESGRTTLMMSLVPEDVGKPTVRLQKAAVQNGTCSWENPVYETVKLIKELKTGRIQKKIYHFIISTGSSKSGFLGEVSVNFADYAEATKCFTLSLPLENSRSSAILHVTIQRMQGAFDEREVEENRAVTINSNNMNKKYNSTEDGHSDRASPNPEQNCSFTASNGFIAAVTSTSDTISKQNSPQKFELKKTTLIQSSMPQNGMVNAITTEDYAHQRSNTDWSVDLDSDGSLVDSANSFEESRENLQEVSERSIQKLKNEISILSRQAEITDLELQSLRKQIVRESKRGQDLSRQMSKLKQERDELKTECKQLQSLQKSTDETEVLNKLPESKNSRALLDEISQDLNHEKELNANLRLQLQRTEDSKYELILAVRGLDEILEQRNREVAQLLSKIETSKNAEKAVERIPIQKLNDDDQDTQEQVEEDSNAKEKDLLKQKITELYSELEVSRRDREELQMHTKQLALDHEILKQENHNFCAKLEQNELQQIKMQNYFSNSVTIIKQFESRVEILETEHMKKTRELLESLDKINKLENQVKSLEEELKRQAQGFEDDLEAMAHAKIEQEQRAVQAEEALRKTRWNNANATEQLQEELRRISVEMESKFDENEKLTKKAVEETNELRLQKTNLEEMLQKVNKELELNKDRYEVKVQELSAQLDMKTKHIEQMSLELDDKSRQLQYAKRIEEEKQGAFLSEIQTLRDKIDMLTEEKYDLIKQAEQNEKLGCEVEQMKTLVAETEMLLQGWNKETVLGRKFATVKQEAEKTQEELNTIKCMKDENKIISGILRSEVENLIAQYNELKHNIYEEKLEKENLRKQVVKLKSELQKKEDTIISVEKNKKAPQPPDSKEAFSLMTNLWSHEVKLKKAALENSANSFLAKEKDLSNKLEELDSRVEQVHHSKRLYEHQFQKEAGQAGYVSANACKPGGNIRENLQHFESNITMGNGVGFAPAQSEVEICSKKEMKVSSTSNTSDKNNLSETTLLKERNKFMESELKEMQERYSEISLKFAEVEGERQQLVMTLRNLKNAKKN
ncbi:uncharacterized protein LOC131146703 isoform X2 [Malania oleifera]|uniref:uncharacterized protein LOC131146703 isoform X2 n=1 Tax=Malania oleifera TaxID=397392 RepID=UPI0025ADB75A|nr:uncharacterized protein LOC131146703 isoform X2 [Malania oleifera]